MALRTRKSRWWAGARPKASFARPWNSWPKPASWPTISRFDGWSRCTLHADAILSILSKCRKVVVVENNYSGQFARYLRSETGFDADGHIRKYDGEPFMPHHIVNGIDAILAGSTKLYVPVHEIQV